MMICLNFWQNQQVQEWTTTVPNAVPRQYGMLYRKKALQKWKVLFDSYLLSCSKNKCFGATSHKDVQKLFSSVTKLKDNIYNGIGEIFALTSNSTIYWQIWIVFSQTALLPIGMAKKIFSNTSKQLTPTVANHRMMRWMQLLIISIINWSLFNTHNSFLI